MSESEAKTLAPTQRKLRKAREKGQIAQFQDMRVLVVLTAGLVFLWLSIDQFMGYFHRSLRLGLSMIPAADYAYEPIIGHALAEGARLLLTFFAVLLGALVVGSLVLNRGFLLSTEQMRPKLNNMSPVKGVKRIFGKRALSELIKSLVRVAASVAVVFLTLRLWAGALVHAPGCGVACVLELLLTLAAILFGAILLVALLAAIIDLPMQMALFLKDQKMTRSEAKMEARDSHGSPEIRKALRRLRNEARQATGKVGLSKASLIVFDEDVAVALRYAKDEVGIPTVVARAKGDATAAFLERAHALSAPFFRDAALARRILANTRPGEAIKQGEFKDTARAFSTALGN